MSKLLFVILILLTTTGVSLGDVLGIHGFVRLGSSLPVSDGTQAELTQVKMELLSMNGNRIMETDCAPNGYFFIPVPKPSKYLVKARGTQGWSFTPSQKTIDCSSQSCHSGKDVIFEVEGFSVKGKVQSTGIKGCSEDAHLDSIVMVLQLANGGPSTKVNCEKDGMFKFEGVMPGKYVISAEHEYWNLIGPEDGVEITTGWESIKIDSVFSVSGFRLRGSIQWDGNPMKGVSVSLFGPQGGDYQILSQTGSESMELPPPEVRSLMSDDDLDLILTVKSDMNGNFVLENIPCGGFELIPWIHQTTDHDDDDDDDQLLYKFDPPIQQIKVPVGDLILLESFKISSFLVFGSVQHKTTKTGIEGVEILINDDSSIPRKLTDEDGNYQFYAKVGIPLNLEFRKKSLLFPSLSKVKVTPFENLIPITFPESYAVCGSVIADTTQKEATYVLKLTTPLNAIEMKETDVNGDFCFWLEPGSYTLEVSGSMVFAPSSRRVKVVDSAFNNLKFIQKRVNLRTKITKMDADSDWSPDLYLTLQPTTNQDPDLSMYLRSGDLEEANGQLIGVFKEILPGDYTLEVFCPGWCWKEAKRLISVSEADVEIDGFVQIGFEKKLMLSHDAKLTFQGSGISHIEDGFYRGGKVHSLCFASSSMHYVNSEQDGCFVFHQDMIINPLDSATLAISAFGFKARGFIRLPIEIEAFEIRVKIISSMTGQRQEVTPSRSQESTGSLDLDFEFIGALGEEVEITPQHHSLIFQPRAQLYSHSGSNCAPDLAPFLAKEGIFIKGLIHPPIPGAEVELWLNGVVISETNSTQNGSFQFGPYYEDTIDDYQVFVEKPGFEFSVSETAIPHFFQVEGTRLVKVEVAIIHQMKRKDKSGILVTITGIQKGFRNNAETNEEGLVSFWKLPGDSYYIKPLLKEYEFQPSFHQIEVDGNRDEFVNFTATRTGFSAFGMVLSLNNNPISDVTVLAIAEENEESCVSDENGRFQLQNLKPDLEYLIRVQVLPPVRKSWPEHLMVKVPYDVQYKEYHDLKDLRFMVFKDDGKVSMNGIVKIEDASKLNATEVKVLRMTKSEGTLHIIATIQPYSNGWFQKELSYPAKYELRIVNKQLDSNCKLPSLDLILDGSTAREVFIGELKVECEDTSIKENVDYEEVSRWPVLLTILAIIVVPFRAQLRDFFVSGS